ncbi:MAG TPA: PHP-associated domain-containing protein [Vicinamibacterales bacterium]|nr:PHP-associated domain-containing protein [Vicinamibacterales bacterium]
MSSRVAIAAASALFFAALTAGTVADAPTRHRLPELGGYVVLAVDFHVHSFPGTWSTLSPCDTVVEARQRGLDAIAMTPHNAVWAGRLGRWCASVLGGPIVLPGEEITTPGYHLLAVGIREHVARDPSPAPVIDAIHRQGGLAIAAHPYENTWPAYDAASPLALDGAEIVRPEAQQNAHMAWQLREFASRGTFAAVGSSDFHGLGPLGYSRTYVFARERSADAVIEAVRARRTVVYDRDRSYGDPALIALAADHGGLPHGVPELPAPGAAAAFSRVAGALALIGVLLFNRW